MTKKIFSSILMVAAAVLLASLVIIMGCIYGYYGGVQRQQLKDELSLAAAAVEKSGVNYLETLSSDRYRLTWIQPDGTVIYDTQTGSDTMENHGDRAEVKEALETGDGESTRYSTTFLEKTTYCAKLLGDGTVLRISMKRATVGVVVLGMMQPILIVLAVALIFSGVLASRLSKRIVEPLNQLDLDNPLENDAYEELSPLLNRINRQHQQISSQLRELTRRTDEFSQITGSMKEGLVLLDNRGLILSINPAAQALFSTDSNCVGHDFLTINRSHEMSLALADAAETGHSETRTQLGGRIYQFDISRVDSQGDAGGMVLLTFDITEQENAERSRREFTANVSHELKTPLQGIIGSAELIENGMVKPEDMPRFIGHIRSEASRLVSLIGDIIQLSQLDEHDELPIEKVELLALAQDVAENLRDAARAKNVSFSVRGEPVWTNGVRRLIYEIIYNLCDNAVKYNRDGGNVDISVSSDSQNAVISVSDTGIGIPPEHQSRVFERFYRVDKSHSKASGGTGLGLSIVKHAVQYLNGKVDLKSVPNEGTTFTVTLPL